MQETDLTPDTLLELAPETRTRYDERRHVLVDTPGGAVVDAGPHGFSVLSLFTRPARFGDVIDRLDGTGDLPPDGVLALSLVIMLTETGALVPSDGGAVLTKGWADPVEHARMLNDHRRTSDYLEAIAGCVHADDVVVDIGTGSGVLAVAAARAGARHVYAVEATDIAEVARGVFAANGLTDRITVVPGWSACLDLPEPADVLVSEIIGSEPLEENLLETTLDARQRLLGPGARVVPNALSLLARPLLVPDAQSGRRAFDPGDVERWQHDYGIDFTPMIDAAAPGPLLDPSEGELVATWPPVGPPAVLSRIDLATFEDASMDATAELTIPGGGALNAVAVTFRAELHGSVVHELDPWTWPASSWATAVWFLPGSIQLDAESNLRVHYRRPAYGTPELTCDVTRC